MKQFLTKPKYIIITITALLLFVLLIVVFAGKNTDNAQKTAPVYVEVLPKNADIYLGDLKLPNSQIHQVPEGTYKVRISSEGYVTHEEEMLVKDGLHPKLTIALKDKISGKVDFPINDLYKLEQVSGRASKEYSDAYEKKYPAKKKLPYKENFYQIGYLSTDGTDFYITVYTHSPRMREAAVEKIESLGINISEYKIKFMDYKMPLEERNE